MVRPNSGCDTVSGDQWLQCYRVLFRKVVTCIVVEDWVILCRLSLYLIINLGGGSY